MNSDRPTAKPSTQTQIFLSGEADRYFERNLPKYSGTASHATQLALDGAVNLIVQSGLWPPQEETPRRMLEVGCANGMLLDHLCRRLGCTGEGLDPSAAAVRDGMQRFPSLSLQVGTAEHLPYEDLNFDLVLLGFFLYLLPDNRYLFALAEANRVLKPGGFAFLVDFDHPETSRRPYSYHAGVMSYRHRAVDVLTATRMYSLVAKWPVGVFAKDPFERVSLSVLYKEADAYPLVKPAP